jgi:hypothetical protein
VTPATDETPTVVRLDDHTIDMLAQRVAAMIQPATQTSAQPANQSRGRTPGQLLSAAQVAERFNVDRDWVYAHADRLGAMRLGTGPKPRLRFDPDRVAAYLHAPHLPAATQAAAGRTQVGPGGR